MFHLPSTYHTAIRHFRLRVIGLAAAAALAKNQLGLGKVIAFSSDRGIIILPRHTFPIAVVPVSA